MELILLATLGAIAGGDRTAFGQTLLAHPLVAATIAGLAWGRPEVGLWVGLTLGALTAARVPVGESRRWDWTSAAIAIVWSSSGMGPTLGLALLGAAPIAWLGGKAIDAVRRVAQDRATRLTGDELPTTVDRVHLSLTGLQFLRGAGVVLATGWSLGWLVETVGPRLGPAELDALSTLARLAPLAGLPILLRTQIARWSR